ncbi:AfsA-related hotdog domain-containing protein [Streptomyces sp. MA5143a]|uniref:AfsA-related hotdog domain-containing protein n=1 Tax=Streptomyces sp. MA5143a TaxID=2083010 RepID=UPI000D1AD9FD|nr:AfsA-related hotdog domain-containing protein [Streptomyces sp. MA5143a]SPF06154.1 A-factor biosynthesis hotdog domain protein [Streptomyces sp. MA5143a]
MDITFTSQPAPSAPDSRGLVAPLHLLHRPVTPEGFLLDAAAPVEQHFALSAELPQEHGTFTDGPGTFHDLLYIAETLRQATHFVAHQYFRVPAERPAVFVSSGLDVLDPAPWRRTGRPAHLTLDLTVTPVDVVNGVPRGLDCRSDVAIDGVPCGSASARLQFLMPGVYRSHREVGRQESLRSTTPVVLPLASMTVVTQEEPAAVAPRSVGREDPRNVVVGPPLRAPYGEFVLPVAADPGHEVFTALPGDHVPGPVFLEASRQASLLAAAELHGLRPAHALLTRWRASFRGFGDADLPLTCTVVAEEPVRDETGRPTVRTRLAFSQGSRVLCTASAVLLQDC